MKIIRKTTTQSGSGNPLVFNLSVEILDAFGDLVRVRGIEYKYFEEKNPVALLQHSSDAPIGFWQGLHVEGNALKGTLVLAPQGTSQKADEARKLIACGVLRGASIGFTSIEERPLAKTGGRDFLRSRLVECSVVSIPACSEALLQKARGMGVSSETIRMLFKQTQNATIGERIARSKAASARARAILAKPALIGMSAETKALYARAKAARARADAILAGKPLPDEDDPIAVSLAKAKAEAIVDQMQRGIVPPNQTPVYEHYRGHYVGLTWRGMKIPRYDWVPTCPERWPWGEDDE